VPYVLIDRLPPGVEAHFVGVKNEEIGALATSHLIEQGCRRIAHIRGPAISTGNLRLQGYRSALAKAGLTQPPEYVVPGDHGDERGYAAMRQLLQLKKRPDGVFCFNDPVAAGAIQAILEAGLQIPRDIAVVGAGNVHYSDQLRVPLTTVDQSSLLTGEKAAEMLVQCIRAGKPLPAEYLYLQPRLVARQSSLR
jgi:LacI family transcriptional regulator